MFIFCDLWNVLFRDEAVEFSHTRYEEVAWHCVVVFELLLKSVGAI